MDTAKMLRTGGLVVILGMSVALGLAAIFSARIREQFVYGPREQSVEDAIRQIAERERNLHETTGNFAAFGDRDIQRNGAVLSLSWNAFPIGEFSFDAVPDESGNLKLRALPKAEAVTTLAVRARYYAAELSSNGEMLRAGWFPAAN